MSVQPEGLEGAALSAWHCRDFHAALMNYGFSRDEAVVIVAAWMARPIGTDAAALNAIVQNMVESMKDG